MTFRMKSLLTSALITIVLALPVLRAEPAAPAATPAYPLTTCVVSGEALGSMGDAYVHIYKEEGKPDREVSLCCKGCLKKFTKDPAKYLGKLDAATQPAAPAVPVTDAHAGHAH
jgi:hypothetical protein